MDFNKKTKIGILTIFLFLSLFVVYAKYQKVNIIYFTNPNCRLTENTDSILQDIKLEFNNRIIIKEIKIHIYDQDKEDTEEIARLREKYQVFGVPEIIINGKKFKQEFSKENIKQSICEEFILKPEVCK
ncbi:MAG: hypothetical protein J7J93_02055 [Candidatus Aenigmarchaeota archaeon]|nr:hypothetical protein [Candidatus Aenigmarchaeota archaeon]